MRRTTKGEVVFLDPGGLDDAPVLGNVAVQDRQPAIGAVGVRHVADTAKFAVIVQRVIAVLLVESLLRWHAAGRGHVETAHSLVLSAADVPCLDALPQCGRVHRGHLRIDESGPLQFAQNGEDAASAVYVLEMKVRTRRHLAQVRHLARQGVNMGHGEIVAGLLGGGKNMQHRIGGAAHGDVHGHGVGKRLGSGDGTRQGALVFFFVIAAGQLDDAPPGLQKQFPAVAMGRHQAAVARQRQPQRLGQTVHGIGGEHARTRPAGGTGRAFIGQGLLVGDIGVGGLDHSVDQVQGLFLTVHLQPARLHGATRDEDSGNIEPQRRHQHAGCDLVAVGDTHQGVGAMGVGHVFHGISDNLARGQ